MSAFAKQETIALIAQLGDLLNKTAEAVAKFGDSIAHLITLGAQGYDAAAARKAHADLIKLRVDLVLLIYGGNRPLIKSIDEYVGWLSRTTPENPWGPESWWVRDSEVLWGAVVEQVEVATSRVNDLLRDVSKIRNDFVLEDAYCEIREAVEGRRLLLTRLHSLQAPVEQDELEELAKAGAEYQRLTEATQKASDQLADYIKSLK